MDTKSLVLALYLLGVAPVTVLSSGYNGYTIVNATGNEIISACEQQNGDLAFLTPESLKNKLDGFPLSFSRNGLWLPLTRKKLKGWEWLDGTPIGISVTQWTEDAVFGILHMRDKALEASAINPASEVGYICELSDKLCRELNNMRETERCFMINNRTFTYDCKNYKKNWYALRNRCKRLGGDLAMVKNRTIWDSLSQEIYPDRTKKECKLVYVGFSQERWVYRTRKPSGEIEPNITYWGNDQPQGLGDCSIIHKDYNGTYVWKTVSCTERTEAVCLSRTQATETTQANEPANGAPLMIIVPVVIGGLLVIGAAIAILLFMKNRRRKREPDYSVEAAKKTQKEYSPVPSEDVNDGARAEVTTRKTEPKEMGLTVDDDDVERERKIKEALQEPESVPIPSPEVEDPPPHEKFHLTLIEQEEDSLTVLYVAGETHEPTKLPGSDVMISNDVDELYMDPNPLTITVHTNVQYLTQILPDDVKLVSPFVRLSVDSSEGFPPGIKIHLPHNLPEDVRGTVEVLERAASSDGQIGESSRYQACCIQDDTILLELPKNTNNLEFIAVCPTEAFREQRFDALVFSKKILCEDGGSKAEVKVYLMESIYSKIHDFTMMMRNEEDGRDPARITDIHPEESLQKDDIVFVALKVYGDWMEENSEEWPVAKASSWAAIEGKIHGYQAATYRITSPDAKHDSARGSLKISAWYDERCVEEDIHQPVDIFISVSD